MRLSHALVPIAVVVAGALAFVLLRPSDSGTGPETGAETTGTPPPRPPEPDRVPNSTRGTLIIRVRTPDSMPLPPGTRAGYVEGLERRMRPPAGDGTFRFTDAPVGKLDVIAEAEGYRPGTSVAIVTPQVPTEISVTLEPKN